MANNYYYYGPMDPDGKGGLGLILLLMPYYFARKWYLKAQKKYEAEQAKKPKEPEASTKGNWWEEPDDDYDE